MNQIERKGCPSLVLTLFIHLSPFLNLEKAERPFSPKIHFTLQQCFKRHLQFSFFLSFSSLYQRTNKQTTSREKRANRSSLLGFETRVLIRSGHSNPKFVSSDLGFSFLFFLFGRLIPSLPFLLTR